jgi:hypothetical protein
MKRFAIALLSLALAAWCRGQSQDFFGCVQSGRTDKVEAMLRADPLLVNALDRAGRPPLFCPWSGSLSTNGQARSATGMGKRL